MKEFRYKAIAENTANVAAAIPVAKSPIPSPLVSRNDMDRRVPRTILLWRLGRIAYQMISRNQGTKCTGYDEYCNLNFRSIYTHDMDSAGNGPCWSSMQIRYYWPWMFC